MIQHLLSRYGSSGLSKLIRDELGPQSDTASIISSAAPSSILSDDASSVWDTQSVRTFSSDTSSITGSIISNVSKGAKFLTRRSTSSSNGNNNAHNVGAHAHASSSSQQADAQDLASDAASTTSGASKQKGTFMCGFCKEEDIVKTCTRKNDLKRHIEDFHKLNAQWFCRHRGCRMVFDWQAAYKTHLKTAHGGSRMSLDEAKVNLCPQVVFACGFENCSQVYEAQGDDDSSAMFKEYVGHVVKHFDEGSNSGEWTYSARIRNLLRQSQVAAAWADSSSWAENSRNQLCWSTQTSGVLRKRLESRHIGDVKLLVQYAYMLGTEPNTPLKFRDDFVTPVIDNCQLSMPGHRTRQPPAMPAQAPPAEDFTFRISRGSNPALAQYIASQRKVYVPGRRSVARPAQLHRPTSSTPMSSQQHLPQMVHGGHPGHHSQQSSRSSNNLGHFFSSIPEAPMYHDPNDQSQYHPATSGMNRNGIIADDLQSLRSITTDGEPADVDMQDTGMMDFSSPYNNYSIQTSQGYQ